MTMPGELARVTGLSRPEAGRGNRALVAEGFATTPATGVYHLTAGCETRLLEDDPLADPVPALDSAN